MCSLNFRLVDDECYPYVGETSRCKVKRYDTLKSAGCTLPTKVPRENLYRVGPAYSLNNESDIMLEIMESGPVQGKITAQQKYTNSTIDR